MPSTDLRGAIPLPLAAPEQMDTTRRSVLYPKLRNIEAFPVTLEGVEAVCLRDPSHLAERPLFVNPSAIPLLSLFDGRRSVIQIVAEYSSQQGASVPGHQVEALIEQLDQSLLLDSDRYRSERLRVEEDFFNSSVRSAAHAGGAYPADPAALKHQLNGFCSAENGPGSARERYPNDRIKALIAPHIDFQRGGHCYAWAYNELSASLDADLYIVLGIGHAGPRHLFSMTDKDFETPLGTMRTDRDFIQAVQEASPFDVFADQFMHRNEHSVEFQVVFLQHLLGSSTDAQIVPILCGSFHDFVRKECSPSDNPDFSGFAEALRGAIAGSGKRICLVVGVDLAHVGKHFGDSEVLSDALMTTVREADRELLAHVENLDSEGLFHHICRDGDQRRVCGYPAIYTALKLTDARSATLLKYDQAADPQTQQAVTFASMVLR